MMLRSFLLLYGFLALHFLAAAQPLQFEALPGTLPGADGLIDVEQLPSGTLLAIFKITTVEKAVYKKPAGDTVWTQLSVAADAISTDDNGVIYRTVLTTLFRSEDEGESWEAFPMGIPGIIRADRLVHQAPATLLMADGSRLFRSGDNGETWAEVQAELGPTTHLEYFLGLGEGRWLLFDELSPQDNTQVYQSEDNGQSWAPFAELGTDLAPVQNDHLVTATGRLLITTRNGVRYSDDQGQTWQAVPFSLAGGQPIRSLAQLSNGQIVAASRSGLYLSEDGGTTFQAAEIDSSPNALPPPLQLWAFPDGSTLGNYSGNICRVENDALAEISFDSYGIERGYILALEAVDPQTLYALTTAGLFKTTNGGAAWELLLLAPIRNSYFGPRDNPLAVLPDGRFAFSDGENLLLFEESTGEVAADSIPVDPDFFAGGSIVALPSGQISVGQSPSPFLYSEAGMEWAPVDAGIIAARPLASGQALLATFEGLAIQVGNSPDLELRPYPQGTFRDAAIYGDSTAYCLQFDSLCITRDQGHHWDCVPTMGNLPFFFGNDQLAVNANQELFAFSGVADYALYSIDQGTTWNELNYPNGQWPLLATELGSDQYLYRQLSDYKIYRTTAPTTELVVQPGRVYFDSNPADCAPGTEEPPMPNVLARADFANTSAYAYTTETGTFQMPMLGEAFTLTAQPPSDYWLGCSLQGNLDLNAGAADTLELGLQPVVDCPRLEVQLSAPFLRRCFESTLYVDYCNRGTVAAAQAEVEVQLDRHLTFIAADHPVLTQTDSSLVLDAGEVAVNACGQIRLTVLVSCEAALGESHCSTARIYPNVDCLTNWQGARLTVDGQCQDNSLEVWVQNEGGAMAGPVPYSMKAFTPGGIVTDGLLIESGELVLGAGASTVLSVPDSVAGLYFEVAQVPGYPYGEKAVLHTQGCPEAGEPFFRQVYQDAYPWATAYCTQNIGSFDPNDKLGSPVGVSPTHNIPMGQPIDYTIRFQNTGTDTAFTVVIEDALPNALDPGSLEVLGASHSFELSITQRLLRFTFPHILLPDSTANAPASNGFVRFRLQPVAGLPFGATANNSAAIYFDFNEPILTNTTRHTFGIPAVTSTLASPVRGIAPLRIFPNPVRYRRATVAFPGAKGGGEITIFNLLGEQVGGAPARSERELLELPPLPAGTYFLHWVDGRGRRAGGKMVVGH